MWIFITQTQIILFLKPLSRSIQAQSFSVVSFYFIYDLYANFFIDFFMINIVFYAKWLKGHNNALMVPFKAINGAAEKEPLNVLWQFFQSSLNLLLADNFFLDVHKSGSSH